MPESVSAIEAQAEYFANIPIIDRTYRASAPLNFFICIDSDLRYLSEEQGIDFPLRCFDESIPRQCNSK